MDNEEMEIGVRCIAVSLGSVHHKFPYAIFLLQDNVIENSFKGVKKDGR